MLIPMNIIQSKAAPPYAAGGTTITGYAAPSRGATEVSLWRIELAPSSSSPLHQMNVEEVFLCLEGRAVVTINNIQNSVGAGDCLILPPATPFILTASPGEPFRTVACMSTD